MEVYTIDITAIVRDILRQRSTYCERRNFQAIDPRISHLETNYVWVV